MNHPSILLSIIIVNWNSRDLVLKCLASIVKHSGEIRYEIIVIDNHSLTSAEELELSESPHVKVVRNHENLGFSKAVNRGVEFANGKLLLLLNPDCTLTKTSLKPMIQAIEQRSEVGMVGPRIYKPDGSIERACRRTHPNLLSRFWEYTLMSRIWPGFLSLLGIHAWKEKYLRSGPAPCIQGSCLLVRTNQFIKIGRLDERIPLFLDDMDLCIRYEQEGFGVLFCAESEVIHTGGQSIKELRNPLHSSLINFMAYDLYAKKHKSSADILGHHIMLFILALCFLAANLILFPLLFIFLKKKAIWYIEKHVWMLIYSLSFCFFPKSFPKTWPHCFFRL